MTIFVSFISWNVLSDKLCLGGGITSLESMKGEFRYYDAYDTFSLKDGVELKLQPESNYIHAIETIFVGIQEDEKGKLEVTLSEGETGDGECVLQSVISVETIPVGEWFQILVEKDVNPRKSYCLRLSPVDCGQAPSLLIVGEDFQNKSTEITYFDEETKEKFLIAVGYREEIEKVYKILLLFLIILIELYVLYKILSLQFRRETIIETLVIATIVLLFLILHFYKLDEYPKGVNVDEMGMLYDAWSLSKYGVDRTLTSFPIYFNNFGNGQSVLYGYLCALFLRIFGTSFFTMRLPAAISSIIILIFGIKIVYLRWGNDKKAIYLFSILYTILPYFVMSSRVALDCNLSLTVSTVYLYYFIKAVQAKKKRYFAIAGIMGGLLLYSYALTWIVLPLFLIIVLLYLLWIKKILIRDVTIMIIPLCILAIPLLLFQWVNIKQLAPLCIGPITIRAIDSYRAALFSWENLLGNCSKIFQEIMMRNGPIYSGYQDFMPMLWISIPFAVVGAWYIYTKICKNLKDKEYSVEGIIGIWFVAQFCVGCILSGQGPTTYRMNGIFFVLLWTIVEGILFVFRRKWVGKKGIMILVVVCYIVGGYSC